MPYIKPVGKPEARIWILLARPCSTDKISLLDGGMGSVFKRMLQEAGINLSNCFVTSRAPNTDDIHAFTDLDAALELYKPQLILALSDVAGWYIPEIREPHAMTASAGQLQKYAGSLLQSPSLTYPHYMMPLYGIDRYVQDWAERNVTTFVDLQKFRDEAQYLGLHGSLQPLRQRVMKFGEMDLDEILMYLEQFRDAPMLSDDIETVYPRKGSKYINLPGYPIVLGLASSPDFGISFRLFRDKPSENRKLWHTLDKLLYDATLLGQNFFNFDALFHNMLGFRIRLDRVQDTLIRHHILWPELPHKLQFLTRQYTREPYYKDEGHGWSVKHMDKLRRYNCLDVCVTYEVWEQQEEEFKQRPQLR